MASEMEASASTDRVEQFKADVAAMRLRDPAVGRDRLLLGGGVAMMVIGLVVAIAAYFLSHGTKNDLQQRDAIVSALIGVALCVTGAALFLRYSLAQFLRFWMARLTYEQAAQTDRLIESQKR